MKSLKTLIFLVAAYIAATFVPQPGIWLRWEDAVTQEARTPKLLLALLLFCAGICTSRRALRSVRRSQRNLVWGLIQTWLFPMAAAVVAVAIFLAAGAPPYVCLGIVIVAAMPIANSSVGWSSYFGGNVATSIALLLAATALSPIITSICIRSGSYWILGQVDDSVPFAWGGGMSLFFVLWVFAPVLAGVLVAGRISEAQSKKVAPIARRISFTVLVVLNYLNGAMFLPKLTEQPSLLVWPIVGALVLLLLAFAFTHLPARLLGSTEEEPQHSAHLKSIELAIILRNTGAALVFAGAALPDFPMVSMTIIAYTLVQHIGVACCVRPLEEPELADSEEPLPPNEEVMAEGREPQLESLAGCRASS